MNQDDLMRKYPEVKLSVEANLEFQREEHNDSDENPYFDTWIRVYESEEEIYNFLEMCLGHDTFQLKHMEITPAEEMESYNKITRLEQKYVCGNFTNMREVYLNTKPCPEQW